MRQKLGQLATKNFMVSSIYNLYSLVTKIGNSKKKETFGNTLLMFCLLNPQTNACEPNPKTTRSDFDR